MKKVRRYIIDKGTYFEQKDSYETTVRFTIYDVDDDMHKYYGSFTFYNDNMPWDVLWDDVDGNEDMIDMDIIYTENWNNDINIFDFILKQSGIDMSLYK